MLNSNHIISAFEWEKFELESEIIYHPILYNKQIMELFFYGIEWFMKVVT